MKEKLLQYVRSLPLNQKITAIILTVDFVLVGICSVVALDILQGHNDSLLYETMAGSISYASTQLSLLMEEEHRTAMAVVTDSTLQSTLQQLRDTKGINTVVRSEAFRVLSTTLQNYTTQFIHGDVDFISLFSPYIDVHTNTAHAKRIPPPTLNAIKERAKQADGQTVWFHDESGMYLVSLVRQVNPFTLETLGTLVIRLELGNIVERCADFGDRFEDSYYLLFDHGTPLYLPGNLSAELFTQAKGLGQSAYQILRAEGHRYFSVTGTVAGYGWEYVGLASYDSIYRAKKTAMTLYLLVLLISALLAMSFSTLLIRRITRHIDRLIRKIKAFGENEAKMLPIEGDYSTRADELGVLHRQFDRMAEKIVHLIRIDYTNQLLMKDAQLRALEAQIDPHFLYNVLASVNWRAKAIGETQISQIIEALGGLLRATLSDPSEIFTIQKELTLVNNYATIQKVRFEDQLIFSIEMPEALKNAKIPKLTIQPLVENAIRYAMQESTEVCVIEVTVSRQGHALCIRVSNTGSSFPEDMLARLEQQTMEKHGFGIGLNNIQQRLRLTFGPEYGLNFFHEKGCAVVQMNIPYQPGEEKPLC